jgi:hypothetical protein
MHLTVISITFFLHILAFQFWFNSLQLQSCKDNDRNHHNYHDYFSICPPLEDSNNKQQTTNNVRFEVHTAVKKSAAIFCIVTLCGLTDGYQCSSKRLATYKTTANILLETICSDQQSVMATGWMTGVWFL